MSTGTSELASTHEGLAGNGPSPSPFSFRRRPHVAFASPRRTSRIRDFGNPRFTCATWSRKRPARVRTVGQPRGPSGGSRARPFRTTAQYLAFESTSRLDSEAARRSGRSRHAPDVRPAAWSRWHDLTRVVHHRAAVWRVLSHRSRTKGSSPFQSVDLFLVSGDAVGSLDVFLSNPTTKLRHLSR